MSAVILFKKKRYICVLISIQPNQPNILMAMQQMSGGKSKFIYQIVKKHYQIFARKLSEVVAYAKGMNQNKKLKQSHTNFLIFMHYLVYINLDLDFTQ